MPNIDGLEFLEAVQQNFDEMPFILLTGAGNESVASKAISQGVSDYISKQQAQEQFPTLVNRITRAVEASELRQEVREKRKLYRTLVEQTDEGICITHDDEIVFVNSQFSSLTGHNQSTLAGAEITAVFGLTGASIERPTACSSVSRQVSEATVKLPDEAGNAQTYQISAKRLQIAGQSVVVWSFRGMTASNRRREQLQRERDLSQAVVDILARSSTHQSVEHSFCTEVIEHHGFQLAWVGEIQQDGQLGIQTSESADGTEAYLDCIEPLLADERQGTAPPSMWALRSDEPQFLDDLSQLPETCWQAAALEEGLRSVAAVPLINHGIAYGVFCVCTTEPATLDAEAKQLLEKLADALADAIADKKRAAALTSRQITEVSFRVGCDQFYLNDIVRGDAEDSYETIVVESVVQSADSVTEFLRVDGPDPERLTGQIAAHETVESVTVEDNCAATHLEVEVAGRTLGGMLQELGVRLEQIIVENDAAEATVQMPVERDQEAVLDRLGQQYDIESMTALTNKTVQPHTTSPQPLETADLTEKQRQALETALEAGYFDQPRGNSANEIAEMLGVSHSTLLQHLRTAQRKIFTKMADQTRH
ncbi:MAG: PAS sensor histidine kinase [Halorubrum sp. J07HR59]|nr:MAG: PAS sensor histidine kinase [Halorubrum sp. J07HR59]